jgi:putative ABC transport system permease protein
MLGIVIGIASVIAMLAIGNGAKASIEANIQSIGSNLIMVTPGAQRGPGVTVSAGRGSAKTLTNEDSDAITASIASIKAVAPEVSGRYQVTAKGKNTNTQVLGTVEAYTTVRNISVDSGSFLTNQNIDSTSRVAVIGPTVRDDLFGLESDPIGETIKINKIAFKVIGVTTPKGGTGFGSRDDVVYIPISSAQRLLSGDQYVTTINIAAATAGSATAVQQSVNDLLMARHNVKDATSADFTIMNQADIVATASSVTSTFTALLGSVAGISLVVGGIGIMNMMLTAVTERTREIGLRKAIGAKKKDISRQFLIESIFLTFIGGVVGIALGTFIASVVQWTGVVSTTVSLSSVVLAVSVSTIIGIVFGYYPAKRAASLNPIDALRYE